MSLVVVLDFGGGDLDGAVLAERIGYIDIVHVGGGIVLCDGQVLLEGILEGAGVEDGAILRIILLGFEGVLQIVPVELETAALIGRDLGDKVADAICGEITVLVHECAIIGNHGRGICTGGKVYKFGLADGDSGSLCVLDEQILVHEFLPCGVADLLLGLLVLYAGSGDDFVDLGKPLHILEVIGIGDCLACYAAHVVFAGHGVQSRLEGARVYNK